MEEDKLRFRAMALSQEELEERFELELSDEEWRMLKYHTARSWSENTEELRSLVIKHIRNGLSEIGYKPVIEGTELKFRKQES